MCWKLLCGMVCWLGDGMYGDVYEQPGVFLNLRYFLFLFVGNLVGE